MPYFILGSVLSSSPNDPLQSLCHLICSVRKRSDTHPCVAGCSPSSRLGHELHRKTKHCLRGETRTPSSPSGLLLRARLAFKHMQDEDQHTSAITHMHVLRNTCCLVAVPLLLSLFPARKLFIGRQQCSECPHHSEKKEKYRVLV